MVTNTALILLNVAILSHICLSFVDFHIKKWIVDNGTLERDNRNSFAVYDTDNKRFQIFGGFYDSNVEYTYNPFNGATQLNQTLVDEYLQYSGQRSTVFIDAAGFSHLYFWNSFFTNGLYDLTNFAVFNVESNTFNQIGKLYPKPFGLSQSCYTNDNQYIYLLGGWNAGDTPVNTMYKFNVNEPKWTIGPSFNVNRSNAACKCVANQLFIFGGLMRPDTASGTTVVEKLTNPDIADENDVWEIVNYSGPMNNTNINMYGGVAVYPVKDVMTNDNWNGNTIFIINLYPDMYTCCFKFNFRTYESSNCTLPPYILGNTAVVYGYISYEYRLYLFGGGPSSTQPTNMIEYAVFEYNGSNPNIECTWSANNGENTLDLRDFENATIIANSDADNQLLYRYAPCQNGLECNSVKDMVDLIDIKTLQCQRYLAIWNGTENVDVYYDTITKSWQFIYLNGDSCDGFSSILTIIWNCDENIPNYNVTSAKSLAQCQDQIIISSRYACN